MFQFSVGFVPWIMYWILLFQVLVGFMLWTIYWILSAAKL